MTGADEDLIAAALQEQKSWEGEAGVSAIALRKETLMFLISTIQLACRHPKFNGPARDQVVMFANEITRKVFPNDPACLELIARGWNPVHDC